MSHVYEIKLKYVKSVADLRPNTIYIFRNKDNNFQERIPVFFESRDIQNALGYEKTNPGQCYSIPATAVMPRPSYSNVGTTVSVPVAPYGGDSGYGYYRNPSKKVYISNLQYCTREYLDALVLDMEEKIEFVIKQTEALKDAKFRMDVTE